MEYNWTDVAQGIGTIAGVIIAALGFIFIYWQIKQAKDSIEQQNHSAIYSMGFELNKVIIENSHLKPYLTGEKTLKSDDPELYRLSILTEMICDYYEYIICERDHIDKRILNVWIKSIRKKISDNEFLRRKILDNSEDYSQDFINHVTDLIKADEINDFAKIEN